jgi:hypothetical protein
MGEIKVDYLKKHKFKYISVIVILLLAIDSGILIPKLGIGRTPIDAISARFDNENKVWRISRIVSEINLDNKRLVFYENYNGNIMVCLLKRKFNGMWKVVGASGEIASNSSGLTVSTATANFVDEWVGCGVVYNDKVERVNFNGKECTIVDEGFMRIWYLIDEEAVKKHEIKVEVLDSNGEQIN